MEMAILNFMCALSNYILILRLTKIPYSFAIDHRKKKKNSGLNDSNPWPLIYSGSDLPTELSTEANWELLRLWVCDITIDDKECK